MSERADLVWLDQLGLADRHQVGSKLARLGAWRARGARVPDAFVLTTSVCEAFLAPVRDRLEQLLQAPPSDLAAREAIAQQARALIEAQRYPPDLQRQIDQAFSELARRTGLGDGLLVAVRSSGVAEDLDAASFAGQYETYLGLRSPAEVLEHIRTCWASQYTARALEYRRQRGLPLVLPGIAVGVMHLVRARSSGVTFTVNPIDGNTEVAVVEANWGFGESVVSGQVTPDHFVVRKADGQIIEQHINQKDIWSIFDDAQGRVVEQPCPPDLASRSCISADELRQVVRLAVEIEQQEGRPQDVEWTIDQDLAAPDNVVLLQHRPETSVARVQPAPPPAPPATPQAAAYDPVAYAMQKVFRIG